MPPASRPPEEWLSRLQDASVAELLPLTDRARLVKALQLALALEYTTIPPYLYALFSLKPGRNEEVAGIIRSVVMQEMLHMALVGNILNAVGARPVIGPPGYVPGYPGGLPGGLLPDVTLSLRRCTVEHVRDCFVAVERPEFPVDLASRRALAVLEAQPVTLSERGEIQEIDAQVLDAPSEFFRSAVYDEQTIGWFYQQIACGIMDLDEAEDLFTGDPARQVVWPSAPGRLYRVTDARTALWAVFEIIRQGEGTPTDPTTGPLPSAASAARPAGPTPNGTP